MVTDASPHFVRSTVAAALFFLPLGIVALVFSSKCQSAVNAGQASAAMRASAISRRFSLAAFIIGGLIYLFLVAGFLLLGAFSS